MLICITKKLPNPVLHDMVLKDPLMVHVFAPCQMKFLVQSWEKAKKKNSFWVHEDWIGR